MQRALNLGGSLYDGVFQVINCIDLVAEKMRDSIENVSFVSF